MIIMRRSWGNNRPTADLHRLDRTARQEASVTRAEQNYNQAELAEAGIGKPERS